MVVGNDERGVINLYKSGSNDRKRSVSTKQLVVLTFSYGQVDKVTGAGSLVGLHVRDYNEMVKTSH